NKKKKIKDLTIIGWGGALTPFNTSFEPPEGETREALERLTTNLTGEFILLLHNPPKDTKLDLVGGKHVGSAAEKELVEKKKPLLVLSAHIHESPGIDKIGDTTIFYPGPVFNGHYGIVEINGKRVKCVSKKITSAA
ncbi:MAG: YfcE family phosphodiesterase, partial [Nanoarchaeota archaeon]|nr:YfcE family phosphodiesterase [Nanoarchaeota archaeon]